MHPKQILVFSLAIALVICADPKKRNVHRLVGGHLKISDQASNDAELLDAQSTGSKDKKGDQDNGVDEEKKTLSQQVADGKYGLIQKELFKKPLKQPGIISYDANPEVPKDNINNLGGLSKEDIWLAENHLLVIKGGTYPKHSDKFDGNPLIWPAIDNYTAPKRPVKIPKHPKVPPPFPVQLTDDGPLQILGTNDTRTLDGPPSVYAVPPPEGGYVPGTGPFFPQYTNQADPAARGAQNQDPQAAQGEGKGGRPFPPSLNGTLPPFFAHLPPGAVAVPPPAPPSINDFDEDDPSIYYPPPYSFSYPSKDNSSTVQAGPLVPGIILPPPPDFFAPQEETTKKPKRPTYTKRPKVQKTTQQSPQIHPTTTPIPPTSVINITLRKPIKVIPNSPTDINNELKPIITTTPISKPPRTTTRPPVAKIKPQSSRQHTKRPSVTILKPVKSVESHRTFYNQAPSSGDPFQIYGPPRTTSRPKTISSTTQVPLKHYYSTPEDINSVIPERSTAQPGNYYYYEEDPQTNSVTTPQPNKVVHNFFNLPDRYFENPRKVPQPRTKYVYVTTKPLSAPRPRYNLVRGRPSFNVHLEKLREQIDYFSSPRPSFREIQSPRPVYQYSFQASNYKPTHQNSFRPSQPDTQTDDEEGFKPMPRYSVQIQQALELSTNQPTPYPPQNQIYFKQAFRATTERSQEQQRYYSTVKPKYTFNEVQTKGRNVLKAKPSVQYSSESGRHNPDYRGFYIKPEDYYDESDRGNNFGQRIPHTTAAPEVRYSTRSPKLFYVTASSNTQKPISLEGDTLVNYLNPRPQINPDAELIPVEAPQRVKYPNYVQRPRNPYPNVQQNYNRRPQVVEAIPISVPNEDARQGSFISYSLPGNNGAHFYFLTPQLAQSRDQGADFYYSQRDSERIRRTNGDGRKR